MSGFSLLRGSVTRLSLAVAIASLAWSSMALAETKFRISVDTGPNHIRNITLRAFMEDLKKRTNGEVVGELFEAGQLYAARDEPKAVARGDIEMSVTSNSSVAAFSADVNILDMPLFSGRSPEQVDRLIDGELGKQLSQGIEQKLGVVVPGRWYLLGFVNTFGAGKTIKSFEDFKGARIRVPGGAGFIARYKALGAEGVSIPFPDVPLALSQGTVDALLTTNETLRSGKLYEAGVKSTFVDQVSVLYYVPLVNKAFWDKLTPEQQAAFRDAWEAQIDGERVEALRRQQAAAEENAKNGVEIFKPDPAELAKVNEVLLGLVPDIAKQLHVEEATVDLAQSELKKLD
jgi:TRAP-type C4-dicarboxylate transport system substrate-binding protein